MTVHPNNLSYDLSDMYDEDLDVLFKMMISLDKMQLGPGMNAWRAMIHEQEERVTQSRGEL